MRKMILLMLGAATLGLSACIAVPVDDGPRRGYREGPPPPHCWWEHGERFCR